MTDPVETIANVEATGRPSVLVDGAALTPEAASRLLRVVVDNDVHLPGMFELTFLDVDGTALKLARITIGAAVTVSGASGTGQPLPVIVGEVTAIEGLVQGITMRTLVRGYTAAHRLQRARRSRSFLNVTDADVARQVATQAGLRVGTVVATSTTHAYLAQVNQTDWEFLSARAAEIGFEMGVSNGLFYFRPGSGNATAAGGGVAGRIRGAAARVAGGGTTVPVRFPDNLISFRPRITAGNLTPDVEVRVWDPMARQAMAQTATTPSGSTPSPNSLGRQFAGSRLGALGGALAGAASALASGNVGGAVSGMSSAVQSAASQATGGLLGSPVGYLGPPPSPTAHVMVDEPFADARSMATSGPMVASALGTDFGSTFAEAEGEAKGNAAIQPGGKVDVQGVQSVFAGTWTVSRARHVFDDSEYGYRVVFSAHGRQDRTVLGLTSKSSRRAAGRGVLDGVVCGVVSNCADPLGKGRVKVALPWLSPDFETDWAPNVQFCSGQRGGAIFMPEIGDEVLVAFEFGDVRRPYVLGSMMNNHTQWSIARSGPIFAGGLMGLASAAAGQAAGAAGSALGASAGPLGAMAGKAIGETAAAQATSAIASSGATLAPGMVSEVNHRGFVSSTGNALLFYDVPLPLPVPTQADVGAVAGVSLDNAGGTGTGGGSLLPPGTGALGSAVRLGSQNGEFGLTVDQVNGGVSLTAKPILGVTTIPVPSINIAAENGFVNIACGEMGMMLVDGGANLIIKSAAAITLEAPTVNVVGLLTVNGVPIPL
ncbi:phage baseplate assembly protein V [Actinophytocola sp. KF-1]